MRSSDQGDRLALYRILLSVSACARIGVACPKESESMNKKETDNANDNRRLDEQSNKAKRWRLDHPHYDRDRRRIERELGLIGKGDALGEMLNLKGVMKVNSDNALVAEDFHSPFNSADRLSELILVAREYGVKTLLVPGDFFDCDNFKEFLGEPWRVTFQKELEYTSQLLQILVDEFEHIYFCRGNHERRWIKGNIGLVTLDNLFSLTKITDGYECTNDNYMILNPKKNPWLICHPKNFSPISLRVPTRLALKYHMNVLSAHGHHWGQGIDDSGKFEVVEAGGMFDKKFVQYIRDISLYGETVSGFYLIQDGHAIPYKGDSTGVIDL